MNRDRIEDNWKQFEGKQKYRLEYSTGDEPNPFAAKHEQTSSNIQEAVHDDEYASPRSRI
jgi:uncharacterized protein YjbJ (UPF0337 family)